MNWRKFMQRVVGAAALSVTMMAVPASARPPRVYVQVGPPAPIVEVRPAVPRRGYVWVPGYHRWDGGRYVWVPGEWRNPPRHRAAWVPGHWAHDRRHGWYFVDGHWR
jgi:hypothetical protein